MPGKNELRWLFGCFFAFIVFWSAWGFFVPATDDAPAVLPAAVAATPAAPAPAAFATLPPSTKTVRTESIVDFSGRIDPVEPSTPAATTASATTASATTASATTASATTASATVVPEGPAAAPPAPNGSRCARYIYRGKAPKREYLLEDMEEKYKAEFAKIDRSSYAVAKCLRQVVPNKGG